MDRPARGGLGKVFKIGGQPMNAPAGVVQRDQTGYDAGSLLATAFADLILVFRSDVLRPEGKTI